MVWIMVESWNLWCMLGYGVLGSGGKERQWLHMTVAKARDSGDAISLFSEGVDLSVVVEAIING